DDDAALKPRVRRGVHARLPLQNLVKVVVLDAGLAVLLAADADEDRPGLLTPIVPDPHGLPLAPVLGMLLLPFSQPVPGGRALVGLVELEVEGLGRHLPGVLVPPADDVHRRGHAWAEILLGGFRV